MIFELPQMVEDYIQRILYRDGFSGRCYIRFGDYPCTAIYRVIDGKQYRKRGNRQQYERDEKEASHWKGDNV